MKKFLVTCATVALAAAGLIAATPSGVLNTTIVPQVATVGTTDLFNDVVAGIPGVPSSYATAAQIAGVPGYANLGAFNTTSFSYTFGNSTVYAFGQPSGTATLVTLTTAANPSDGQRECFLSTQTTTTLTWNANTGQSISGAPTAGTANSGACMTYVASLATWYRS